MIKAWLELYEGGKNSEKGNRKKNVGLENGEQMKKGRVLNDKSCHSKKGTLKDCWRCYEEISIFVFKR